MTADEIAEVFKSAEGCVTFINRSKHQQATDTEWKDDVKRNWQHLEIIKAYKQDDGTTSIWTTEDFTAIDAAVTAGKAKLA